jgi:hypothetical protein
MTFFCVSRLRAFRSTTHSPTIPIAIPRRMIPYVARNSVKTRPPELVGTMSP